MTHVINAQCDRINRRVQEMLEVIRFRTAPLGLHPVDFDLGALAQQVVQRMQSATESHRLLFHQDAPAPVRADREHIEEVLVSLLDNAIKYAQEGGEIHVRVWSHDEGRGSTFYFSLPLARDEGNADG